MRSNSLKSISEIVETLAHLYLQASNYTKIEHFHEIRFKDFEHSYKRAVSHHSFLQNNQFSCNLFFTITHIDFASYADDNIPYTFPNDIKEVFWKLKIALEKLFPQFRDDQMKANPDKCYLLCNTNMKQQMPHTHSYINKICKQAGLKFNTLSRKKKCHLWIFLRKKAN